MVTCIDNASVGEQKLQTSRAPLMNRDFFDIDSINPTERSNVKTGVKHHVYTTWICIKEACESHAFFVAV